MTMYAFNRQVHLPTAVEHSLYCNFFSSQEKNLVVAGVNQLTVFKLSHHGDGKGTDKHDPKAKKAKLEQLAAFSLFGNVVSMQCVRLAGAPRDSLLLSFREAKLSLVEYDPDSHDLKTSSLHYFEEYELKSGYMQQSVFLPLVRVDPEGRCAAMLIYGTKLVILPFRRDSAMEEAEASLGISKPPIMSSYIIDLRTLDEKITNVLDFHFLHGYYEPTIFILYEPLPTWAGRIAVRKDSCSIVAISLNLQEKAHPVIWSLAALPFDCLQAFPVQKPIGGVLVFAVNSLIYLNQSVPPYAVSLNSITDVSTDFLLKPQDGVKMTLDCAEACFISNDQLVISLKGGELYVLSLVVDSLRAVRGFSFDKAAASVLTTSMCNCENGFLFLGSRLGNSLLLKYTEKAPDLDALKSDTSAAKEKSDEPPQKKKKSDSMGDWIATDVKQMDDLDELEVYGSEPQIGHQGILASYTFEVCDSILNIGPCGHIVMGEPAFLSEEFSSTLDPDLELVTTSGYGKNGALSVLQHSIRPQVVTTFELPGCQDMWTVIGAPINEAEKKAAALKKDNEDKTHSLLIMSRDEASMILQTGQEIMELDKSGFLTQETTVAAGNLGNNRYVVQVVCAGVRLLEGVRQVQHIAIDLGTPLVDCSIADPYVVVLSQDGQVVLLMLKPDTMGNMRLIVTRPGIHQNTKVTTLSAYTDVSGMFTTQGIQPEGGSQQEGDMRGKIEMSFTLDKSVEDEDELLYGDSEKKTEEPEPEKPTEDTSQSEEAEVDSPDSTKTYWVACARESGNLEIYSIPEFKLSFVVRNFPVGHKLLVDSNSTPGQSGAAMGDKPAAASLPVVKELLIVGLGNVKSRPHLLARVDDELYVYEAFQHHTAEQSLKLRFRKIPHGLILREKRRERFRKKGDEEDERLPKGKRTKWLRPFSDISGYSGVFVCGPYPHWLFMSARGALRVHPMGIDGWVTSFAPFNNVNCPKGFLYFNKQGELRISVLPTHLSYDAPWPIRKVALRCTPHLVIYHPESKTYSVVTSVPETLTRLVRVMAEGEKEFETPERPERYIYPTIERFSVQLFSPVSWEAIPNTKHEFEEFEHVTCMRHVTLKSQGTVSGMKGYISIGTNLNHGEELSAKGRILILDVIDVVPEPGQPLTKNKMKIVHDKEQKGPLTAIDSVNGFLVTAIGQKIYIWTLKDDDLLGVAFIDTQIYICNMSTIKNMILVGDILKSVSLLRYQTDLKVLSLVSRDVKPLEVFGTAFMVDNTNLCFLVSDRDKNLMVYTYQPEVRESHGGSRLIRQADMNIGSLVNSFFRIRCKLADPSTDRKASSAVERRHINFYATLDGSLGYILPITEKVYRRLLMLQNALTVHIPHCAGLNPKAYRLFQSERKTLGNPHRNILDGDLLWKYLSLSTVERNELAKRIGTTVDQIVDDLLEMDRHTAHF